MIIDGILGSSAIDSSGEILSIEGADISDVDAGTVLANWEHAPGEKGADTIVGRVVFAKKLYSKDDCDNERQRMYWDKLEMPMIYGRIRLFDTAGHKQAKAIAAIIRDQVAHDESLCIRLSVEGSTLSKKNNVLERTVIRALALTVRPCNRTAVTGLISDEDAPDGYKKKHEKEKDPLDFDSAEKSSNDGLLHRLGATFEFVGNPELPDEEFPSLDKALSAGTTAAAPSTLTGGAALQPEHLSSKKKTPIVPASNTLGGAAKFGPGVKDQKAQVNQAFAAHRDFGTKVNPYTKLAFKKFAKNRLPEASDEFIDHFADLVEDYDIKRSQLKKREAPAPAPKAKVNKKPAPGLTAPSKAPANDNKAPAKAPKLPKQAQPEEEEANEEDVSKIVIRDLKLTVRGNRVELPPAPPKKKVIGPQTADIHFDEVNGVLHTPKGSISLYNPDTGLAHVEHKDAIKKGPFYRNGILHIAPGTDPNSVAGYNGPNANFRKIWAQQEDFHSGKVMPNWAVVHKLTREGKLPLEVIMHAAIFSMLSPNTPVPVQELMHAHMVDTWEEQGIDPTDPTFGIKARQAYMDKDRGTNYPRTGEEDIRGNTGVHLQNPSELKGRKIGELMSFALRENKFNNIAQYHQLHSTLVNLVREHGTDARGANAALMKLKVDHEKWKLQRKGMLDKIKLGLKTGGLEDHAKRYYEEKNDEAKRAGLDTHKDISRMRQGWRDEARNKGLIDELSNHAESTMLLHPTHGAYSKVTVPGLAPKTGRFAFSMLGGGNSLVPDTHIIRHLFGMDADKDTEALSYLKSVLWKAGNHHILEKMDKWYSNNHPAAKLMQEHPEWKQHFENPEQAVFPAFWRHWCCIRDDELARGLPNTSSNAGTTHGPFWDGIKKYVKGALGLKKGEFDHPMQAKLLALHAQYEEDHGEVPAQMMYFAHIVPHLLEAAAYRERHEEPAKFIKSVRLHGLDIRLRKAIADAKDDIGGDEPTVHGVYAKIDGKEHRTGRFMVHGGQLDHLEDYHGILARFVPKGPVTTATVSKIHALQMSPDLSIRRESPDPEHLTAEPTLDQKVRPELPTAPPAPPKPSVFSYQRAGMTQPHTLEVQNGTYLLDGKKLSSPEVTTILTNLNNGSAKLRYTHPAASRMVQKMEAAITDLIKTTPQTATTTQTMGPGMQRHIYEDKMVPGAGNRFASDGFIRKRKPGVYVRLDANDLKEINSAHGHSAGDNAIKAIGGAVRDSIDETVGKGGGNPRTPHDMNLYRTGGDDFLAHFPSHEHAARFARALQQKLGEMPAVGGTHKPSIAYGFGLDPGQADDALFAAKSQKSHESTGLPKYKLGQVPNLGHSLVPGYEGPMPVHDPGASALDQVLNAPRAPPEPPGPTGLTKALEGASFLTKTMGDASFLGPKVPPLPSTVHNHAGLVSDKLKGLNKNLVGTHPEHVNEAATKFETEINHHPVHVFPTGENPGGVEEKAIYPYSDGSRGAMVKHMDSTWGGGGLNESISQRAYHAAGIGHLHQKSHVTQVQPGRGEAPGDSPDYGLVIHREAGLPYWERDLMERKGKKQVPFTPDHLRDFRRIGIMDHALGNTDRHPGNLMVRPDGSPMAIDNGASFREHHTYATRGGGSRFRPGLMYDQTAALEYGGPLTPEDHEWWKSVRPAVEAEVANHARHIPDEEYRGKFLESFRQRLGYMHGLFAPGAVKADGSYSRGSKTPVPG